MPHELGKLPLTYYQTLVDFVVDESRPPQTRNDGDGENGDVVSVDVDDMIRKGRTSGFGAT